MPLYNRKGKTNMWQKMLQTGSGGSSSFQFSTLEQKTNMKWTNGKPIYCKTTAITIPSSPSSTENMPTHSGNLVDNIAIVEDVIYFDASIQMDGTKHEIKLPFMFSTNNYMGGYINRGTNFSQLVFYTSIPSLSFTAWLGSTGYVTIYYTKTTD